MKSILMSIQPKWCEKIINGEKTIEVRKTAPKEVPFKVYIYCTKGRSNSRLYKESSTDGYFLDREGWRGGDYEKRYLCGKIIGEFVCDKVICLTYETKIPTVKQNEDGTLSIVGYTTTEPFYNGKLSTIKGSCLEQKQLLSYGKGKTLYGLHITDLKVYDKPKELGEITAYTIRRRYTTKKAKEFTGDGINIEKLMHGNRVEARVITKPPQSWQYVGEVEE